MSPASCTCAGRAAQVFEGRVVDGDNRSGGHVITATAGSGPSKQTFNYATERIVGNGSFGTVFQATCLETAETVGVLHGLLVVGWQRAWGTQGWILLMQHGHCVAVGHHSTAVCCPGNFLSVAPDLFCGWCYSWRVCTAPLPFDVGHLPHATCITMGMLPRLCHAVLCCVVPHHVVTCRWPLRRCCRTSGSRTGSCRS